MAVAAFPPPGKADKACRGNSDTDAGALLAWRGRDRLVAEPRWAYEHPPSPRRRQLIARIVTQHALARLRRVLRARDGR